MRLVLHIGTEKTATTTLQHFLYHNRAALAARGVALSDACGSPNNRRLAAYCQPETRFDNFFQTRGIRSLAEKQAFYAEFETAFKAEVADLQGDALILTSEHLHSRLIDRDCVQKLHDLVAPLFSEIRVICYFREQAAVAKSLYSTAIKGGKSESFASFLDGCTPDNHRYNYHSSFSIWADVFGADALVARVFDKGEFVGGDICADFLDQACGFDMDGFEPVSANQNESLGAHGLMLGRITNRTHPRYLPDGGVNPLRKVLAETLETTDLAGQGVLGFADAGEIHDRFKESNRAFAQAFLGRDTSPFAAPRAPVAGDLSITAQDLETFWQQMLDGLHTLPQLPANAAATLRSLARRIEAGEPLGRPEAKTLKSLARAIKGKADSSPISEPVSNPDQGDPGRASGN